MLDKSPAIQFYRGIYDKIDKIIILSPSPPFDPTFFSLAAPPKNSLALHIKWVGYLSSAGVV